MEAEERLLLYAAYDTQSDESSEDSPSSAGQWRLARRLYEELRSIGAQEVSISEHGYVFATIPASSGYGGGPVLGLLAHMDTAPAVSGSGVRPRVLRYEGGDLTLDEENGVVLEAARFPDIQLYTGQDVIVSDGSTLLGSDDKAGVAEIMTMAEHLLTHPETAHGKLRIAFTPDEEIGRGPLHFDVEAFGADFAYTVDGGVIGELEYENFNAAAARVVINGVSVHPGSARGRMLNASLLAMEFHALLPAFENPACTDGYWGFYHLDHIEGREEQASLHYIVRDHDSVKFAAKLRLLEQARDFINSKYGPDTAELEITEQYRNMAEQVLPYPQLIDHAVQAFADCGVTAKIQPIRGGTDGARLSFMGLPCPNLSTGGHYFHSRFEFIPVSSLRTMSRMLVRLAELFGQAEQ